MIYCLTGEVLYVDALTNTAVIDCGGVGYRVTATGNAISYLAAKNEGEKVRIFTYMAVREDAMELYGFKTKEELATFKMLISVSGVGPKAGVSILTALTPEAFAMAVSTGDIKALSSAPGIGKRTAERIILELKDKLSKAMPELGSSEPAMSGAPTAHGSAADARDALLVLGYTRAEVDAVLRKIDKNMATEDIIRAALSHLMI